MLFAWRQKPVEPPTVDPIVGTYHVFFKQMPERQAIYRIYADGRAVLASFGMGFENLKNQWNWEKDVGWYDFTGLKNIGLDNLPRYTDTLSSISP